MNDDKKSLVDWVSHEFTWKQGTLIIVGALLAIGLFMSKSQGHEAYAQASPTITTESPAAKGYPEMVKPHIPTLAEQLTSAQTIDDMFNICNPRMSDKGVNDPYNPGALCVALWGSFNLKWADVSVLKDETSPGLVMKNSTRERGKRLCASGSIIQIAETEGMSEGLFMSNGGALYHYANVKSSGDLTEGHNARLCGYVVGTYDYHNSGGGVGHAVDVVGMWDLKENKQL
jgi:hypothetical protein